MSESVIESKSERGQKGFGLCLWDYRFRDSRAENFSIRLYDLRGLGCGALVSCGCSRLHELLLEF